MAPAQMELEGVTEKPDMAAIVAKTTATGGAADHRYPAHPGRSQGGGHSRLSPL